MSAVVFEQFSYAYKGTGKVLNDITLAIPQGSFTVITGPSGAGKTTLCMAIAGIVPHYFGGSLAGKVLVKDCETTGTSMARLSEDVGTVLEDYESQLVTMTVEEEVAFSLENRGMKRSDIYARVQHALTLVGLKGLEQREVSALSGGQRQRLVIASVLASQPSILVLDEPTSALDPEGAAAIYTLLGKLNKQHGITVIVVEHDLARVLPYADQFVLLSAGSIVKTGTPGEVLAVMARNGVYPEGVPPLWQLKFKLEHKIGLKLGEWLTEEQAVAELKQYLSSCQKGVSKSA